LWITNGKGVLLQLRATQKKSFPNKWDISVAGHVDASESPLQAFQREYQEELGINWGLENLECSTILKS